MIKKYHTSVFVAASSAEIAKVMDDEVFPYLDMRGEVYEGHSAHSHYNSPAEVIITVVSSSTSMYG